MRCFCENTPFLRTLLSWSAPYVPHDYQNPQLLHTRLRSSFSSVCFLQLAPFASTIARPESALIYTREHFNHICVSTVPATYQQSGPIHNILQKAPSSFRIRTTRRYSTVCLWMSFQGQPRSLPFVPQETTGNTVGRAFAAKPWPPGSNLLA